MSRDETAPSDNGSDGSFKITKRQSQAAAPSKIAGMRDMHIPQGSSKPRLSIGTSD